MATVKEQAARILEHLPDSATWDDLIYQIHVRQGRAAKQGRPEDGQIRAEIKLPETVSEAGATFSQRWRGKFVPADRGGERYRALAKRYL